MEDEIRGFPAGIITFSQLHASRFLLVLDLPICLSFVDLLLLSYSPESPMFVSNFLGPLCDLVIFLGWIALTCESGLVILHPKTHKLRSVFQLK